MVDYMVQRIGPIKQLLLLVEHFGPTRDSKPYSEYGDRVEKVASTFNPLIPDFFTHLDFKCEKGYGCCRESDRDLTRRHGTVRKLCVFICMQYRYWITLSKQRQAV